jgi:hypothetical protein
VRTNRECKPKPLYADAGQNEDGSQPRRWQKHNGCQNQQPTGDQQQKTQEFHCGKLSHAHE